MPAPDNPVLLELWRDHGLESQHRGAWALVDTSGEVIDAAGDPDQRIFPRSATKSMQGLAFLESGAADAIHAGDDEIALAVSSHSGEPVHVAVARGVLDRSGLDATALRCGPQKPMHPAHNHEPARRISNNCSGKHSAFLATAVHLADDPADYLEHSSVTQVTVRAAVAEMTDTEPVTMGEARDGCSAPTFEMPLRSLATGLARVANPARLRPERAAACRRITAAAAAHPELIGGTVNRLDTDLVAATNGRVFAKGGAEGVFAIGIVDADVGLAVKIDDGNHRGYTRLVVELLVALGHVDAAEAEALSSWTDPTRRNWDGLDIGRTVIPDQALPS